ncbi:MAG: cytochrome c peroxidase [Acidobacteriota bacterium]
MRHVPLWVALLLGGTVTLPAARPRAPLGLDLFRPYSEGNIPTAAKIALGRQLFNDRRLSRDGSLSCAGCHDPRRAFTDGRVVALGVDGAPGSRNVPSLINRAWGTSFFWDGRASTLEQQALQPILSPAELGMAPEAVMALARSAQYRSDFVTAFGAEPTLSDVARALASYVRTIVAGSSPFDRYVGGERGALGGDAIRGLGLFRGKAGCTACHAGPTLSDERFHNTGVAWRTGRLSDDGRARVTGAAADRGAFKTPSLRQVTGTAPYMHDGSFATLEQVIDYYDAGGQANPALDTRIRPLHLSAGERRDLLAFLAALTGKVRDGF